MFINLMSSYLTKVKLNWQIDKSYGHCDTGGLDGQLWFTSEVERRRLRRE